jgi:hypothetical protein
VNLLLGRPVFFYQNLREAKKSLICRKKNIFLNLISSVDIKYENFFFSLSSFPFVIKYFADEITTFFFRFKEKWETDIVVVVEVSNIVAWLSTSLAVHSTIWYSRKKALADTANIFLVWHCVHRGAISESASHWQALLPLVRHLWLMLGACQ